MVLVSLSACGAPDSGKYSWKETPSAQLQASTGVDLGVGSRGHIPARIAVVCDDQQAVRLVLRSKLPSAVTDYLPERDVLQLFSEGSGRSAALKPSFAFSTIRDGALASSISDAMDLSSTRALSSELAFGSQKLLGFGIRESLFEFEIGLTQSAFDDFVRACQIRNMSGRKIARRR
ncbi:hypothetical protein [Caulobacter segnis]